MVGYKYRKTKAPPMIQFSAMENCMLFCSGCDKKKVNSHLVYMSPCACLLCSACYLESFEENDLYCVGSDCSNQDNYAQFNKPTLIKFANERLYPIGSRDLLTKYLQTADEIISFKTLRLSNDPRVIKFLEEVQQKNIKSETSINKILEKEEEE